MSCLEPSGVAEYVWPLVLSMMSIERHFLLRGSLKRRLLYERQLDKLPNILEVKLFAVLLSEEGPTGPWLCLTMAMKL